MPDSDYEINKGGYQTPIRAITFKDRGFGHVVKPNEHLKLF